MPHQLNAKQPLNATPRGDCALSLLRSGTEDLHRGIERRVDLDRIARSVDEYAKTLAAFYGFYHSVEQQIDRAPHTHFDFALEVRAERIREDLSRLGKGALIAALPEMARLPEIGTTPELIGILYVVEGSSLGGQIIARRVREHLGIEHGSGGSFFGGHGDVGKRWLAFRLAANSMVRSPVEREVALRAARDTFIAFDAWLASCGLIQSAATTKES